MITIEHSGRFGNYLFQVAATMGIAERFGDNAEFESYIGSPEFKNHYTEGVDVSWWTDFNLPKRSNEIENIYDEVGHGFQEIPQLPNLCLKGFFQSEKYFSNVRDKLLETFRIPETINKGTVALHYRRGDFYLYPELFPILSESYFIEAADKLYCDEIGGWYSHNGRTFIVFSDEIETCKKIFSQKIYRHFDFEYSENKNPLEDFYAMCQCEHFIISNSAFSWMAAWLSRSQDKIVICPKEEKWYGKSGMDTKDLLPETWIKI